MSFWQEYENINEELNEVRNMIIKSTKSKYLGEVMEPMIYSSGKMLRPAFVLLAGKFGHYDASRLKKFAMIIEILHMATLIHDDIIDDADMRRGQPSIQAEKGKNAAVFIGDYYLCQCFLMLSSDYEQEDLQHIARVINAICLAEVQQNFNKRNNNLSVRNYLKVISGKTAALFALSFYMGAKVGNCELKLCQDLGRLGKYIGMAFQIMDDILDYSSDQLSLGKENNKDIQQGYYTLPLIYALNNDKNSELKNLLDKEDLTKEEYALIVNMVNANGGISYSMDLAQTYVNKAFDIITHLPEGESKTVLKDITDKLLKRKY
ncbi:MAG: heptaprenyl diphosphate synthase [Firmicutes bacterium HGW-Firmicutes-1]|jgi:heptaprenyl diphosphate synthase|nr:MAG: heptaprenyl diphosphate synthase [Firmicutes bacterium HGW-Firmicutes-1]